MDAMEEINKILRSGVQEKQTQDEILQVSRQILELKEKIKTLHTNLVEKQAFRDRLRNENVCLGAEYRILEDRVHKSKMNAEQLRKEYDAKMAELEIMQNGHWSKVQQFTQDVNMILSDMKNTNSTYANEYKDHRKKLHEYNNLKLRHAKLSGELKASISYLSYQEMQLRQNVNKDN